MDSLFKGTALPYIETTLSKDTIYHYYRRKGIRTRINANPDTSSFMDRYNEIHQGFEIIPVSSKPGSLAKLIEEYLRSDRYKDKAKKTMEGYRFHLDRVKEKYGKIKARSFTTKFLIDYHESLRSTPASANNMLKAVSDMCKFGVRTGLLLFNPATRDIDKFKSGQYEPWTLEAIQTFIERSSGAVLRAFMHVLYSSQRLSDCLEMTWPDNGFFVITQLKGRDDRDTRMVIPVHPKLEKSIDEWRDETPDTLYIVTHDVKHKGEPYSTNGFKSIWNRHMKSIGLIQGPTGSPMFTFHGLRYTSTENLLLDGLSTKQAMAITGHRSPQMVEKYGRRAEQRRLASQVKEVWDKNSN